MARIPLTGGSYMARSVIASAQRCLNLYPEPNPEGSPVPMTYYPRPGLTSLADPTTPGVGRCLYRASNGVLYGVVGQTVYLIGADWSYQFVGTLLQISSSIVSMADNGIDIMIVDGSQFGYVVNMTSGHFSRITSESFYGADYVQYVDTFFVLNKLGSPVMYISGSNDTTFDPLDFASKTGSPDNIVAIQITHREIWLIGEVSTEVWYNTGAADFTFGPISGVYIEHGCCAKYSVAKQDLSTYWLSQDQQGHLMVLEGNSYQAKRVSTFAIEVEIQSYASFDDAVGFTYQFQGHTFYQLNFPTEGKTWIYDASTALWHEESWTDADGNQQRHRANCAAFAYGKNVMADWETGTLYELDPNAFTDDGNEIVCLRSFPHIENDGKRITHRQFIADMEVGEAPLTVPATAPMAYLRWSDTRGKSWGNRIEQSVGAAGEYLISMQFQRLGMGRDRIYELSWSAPFKTALNGAWLDYTVLGS